MLDRKVELLPLPGAWTIMERPYCIGLISLSSIIIHYPLSIIEGPIAQVWYLHYPLAGPATVFLNNWIVKPRGVKIEDPWTPKPSSMLILDFKMKYGEFLSYQAQHNRFQQ